jgi:hypothetical protein
MVKAWTNAEINKARKLKAAGMKHDDIAKILKRTFESVRIKLGRVGRGGQVIVENRKNGTAEVNAEVPRIMSDKDLLKFLR